MEEKLTLGQKLSDAVSNGLGTWWFIGGQAAFITGWMIVNALIPQAMDKYPYVFLNLLVGFESAFTAPILLMAGNRQSEIDRKRIVEDLELDRKQAEMVEELKAHFKELSEKIDNLEKW